MYSPVLRVCFKRQINQSDHLVFACLDALVFCTKELVAARKYLCPAFFSFSVKHDYIAQITVPNFKSTALYTTQYNYLGVVYWGYCGKLATSQDDPRHTDKFPAILS